MSAVEEEQKARVVGGVRNRLGRAQAVALWGTSGTLISIETSTLR